MGNLWGNHSQLLYILKENLFKIKMLLLNIEVRINNEFFSYSFYYVNQKRVKKKKIWVQNQF